MQETQEMQVSSLGWEDPLEEEMATWASILAWLIPWTEEPGKLQSMGLQRVRHNWAIEHTLTQVGSRHTSWEDVRYLPSVGYLEPVATAVIVWFPVQATEDSRLAPGLVATDYEVLFLHMVKSMVIVHLYIWSLIGQEWSSGSGSCVMLGPEDGTPSEIVKLDLNNL